MANAIGIYRVASPSGKMYIGQSWRLRQRFNEYRNMQKNSVNKILLNSLKKYGFEAHDILVVHELPSDVSQEVLDAYELFYCEQYQSAGITLMNIKEAGRGGRHSDETKKIIGQKSKQKFIDKPKLIQELAIARTGKAVAHTEEFKKALSERNKGNKYNLGKKASQETIDKRKAKRFGYKHSQETIEKIREANTGRKLPKEQIEAHRIKMTGRKYSDAHKAAISAGNKGKKISDETKAKLKKANTGRVHSAEEIQKRVLKATGQKRSDEAKRNISNSLTGKVKSKDHVRKIADKHQKPVMQFSANHIFIKEWPSIGKASEGLLLDRTMIGKACKIGSELKQLGGFYFRFKNG